MDSKELRSLMEAYQQVNAPQEVEEEVENVEEGLRKKVGEKIKKHINKYAYQQGIHDNPGWLRKPEKRAALNKAVRDDIKKNPKAAVKYAADEVKRKVKEKLRKEEVDIYDIILSHLIDEGYAETQKAAEAIMVNMSEEWRDSIVEEMLDEGYKELPVDKMIAKSKSLTRRTRKPGAPRWEKEDERASKIKKTAGTHSRAAVRKVEKANKAL